MRFGASACAACGARVSRRIEDALHARLEASSQDYRELQGHVRSARLVLFIAATLYIVFGVIAFLGSSGGEFTTPEIELGVRIVLFIDVAVASVFLLLWWTARARPASSMIAAALLWLAYQLFLLGVLPIAVASGLWFKGVVAILMVRGIVAGIRAQGFLRKLQTAV